jgi:phosphoesterase RecJ-like protein
MYAATLIGEMAKEGIDHSEYARILHDSYTEKDLKARMIAIENLKVVCNEKLAYIVVTNDMLEKEELSDDNTGSIVDIPRSVEGVLVGVSIKQNSEDPTEYRISARSNSEVDVSEVCGLFGGGGHKKAAGGRLKADTCKEAVNKIVSEFEKAVEKYLEERS